MRYAALASALVVAALPATAQATEYGGGTAPETKGQSERQLTLVGIRTADDGSALTTVKVATPCGLGFAERRVQFAADGTFSLDVTVRSRVREDRRVRQRARIRMAGHVAGASASGTVRADLRLRRGGGPVERCSSGVRTWQARAAAAEATSAAPQAGGAYHGLTSQAGRPFVLRVDPQAARVGTAAFEYRVGCSGPPLEWENVTPGAAILADGTFHLRERFTYRWEEGGERFRVRVDGRFTTTGVSGTLSVSSVLRAPGGRVLDRCTTNRQTFAAQL